MLETVSLTRYRNGTCQKRLASDTWPFDVPSPSSGVFSFTYCRVIWTML